MTRSQNVHRIGRSGLLAASLALAGAVVVAPAGPARAAALTCNTQVTTSISLTADLTCAAGVDGLRVSGRQGTPIVIDLKGHTIRGAGPYTGAAGVRVEFSSNVEVRNGTVTGFDSGVVLDTATANHVWNLTLVGNLRGVNLANASGNLVDKNRVSASELDGIRLGGYASSTNQIVQNELSGNVFGIGLAEGSRNLVAQNKISGSRGWGIAVFSDASTNTVSRNVVSTSVVDGILVTPGAGDSNVLSQNQVTANADDGIDVDRPTTLVAKNLATYNGDYGIVAGAGVVDDGGNQAWDNGNPDQCSGVTCAAA